MKVTAKLEKEVLVKVAGEDILPLVTYLKKGKNISEFVIAEDLEVEINVIRNKLYRLLNANLVSFTRKKDKQKGWYIYYWTYSPSNIAHLYWDAKHKELDDLQMRLTRETTNVFFACPSGCIRLDFDKALDFAYQCPECGALLEQQNTVEKTKNIRKRISTLEAEIKDKPITVISKRTRQAA